MELSVLSGGGANRTTMSRGALTSIKAELISFPFMSNRHLSADLNQSIRPTSAQLEQLHIRHSLNSRPKSDQIPLNYKSPEAQGRKF
jgi:hypothetical protein